MSWWQGKTVSSQWISISENSLSASTWPRSWLNFSCLWYVCWSMLLSGSLDPNKVFPWPKTMIFKTSVRFHSGSRLSVNSLCSMKLGTPMEWQVPFAPHPFHFWTPVLPLLCLILVFSSSIQPSQLAVTWLSFKLTMNMLTHSLYTKLSTLFLQPFGYTRTRHFVTVVWISDLFIKLFLAVLDGPGDGRLETGTRSCSAPVLLTSN